MQDFVNKIMAVDRFSFWKRDVIEHLMNANKDTLGLTASWKKDTN